MAKADLTPINPATESFGEQNAQLATLLDLQYQMQVLKRLIDYEQSVNQIVQAAINIGVSDPAIAAPNEDLCRQVPANIPCAQAYDALYPDFSMGNVLTPLPAPEPVPTRAVANELPVETEVPQTLAESLYWTDITCLAQKCTAIISPDVKNPQARYRISTGETLPDGAVIKSISASGVVIERGKKSITLEPAPQA